MVLLYRMFVCGGLKRLYDLGDVFDDDCGSGRGALVFRLVEQVDVNAAALWVGATDEGEGLVGFHRRSSKEDVVFGFDVGRGVEKRSLS